jgi:hypothetical protein
MTRKAKLFDKQLTLLEAEFEPLLMACLKECSDGRWGLFGQNDRVDPDRRYSNWSEADRLKSLAEEIHSIRAGFGKSNPLCERFLDYCALGGANVPGEPKLAQRFLDEIGGVPH